MAEKQSILEQFHPLVGQWFEEHFGRPTDVQEKAWSAIAAGEHVLAAAPTGSGKTLAAFLWAVDRLITGGYPAGCTSILYISPLKALNNDIRRNLIKPLAELETVFVAAGTPFPNIRVMTRSGDTPQSHRRKMQRQPPEILITTPESLNLLLSSKGGKSILGHISTVILDEIHSVINTKRGTHLITAVDRLTALSGEFQRIALSATIKPLETVAAFIGGRTVRGGPFDAVYAPRPVSMIRADHRKIYAVSVTFPEAAAEDLDRIGSPKKSIWEPIVDEVKQIIEKNRSTLIFVNSRRLCEKLTFLINREETHPIAYAHHGSLSRELRRFVEQKLKDGELRAIVATNSLELGIDIGNLDQVLLIQTPPSISSGIQRIGRAGHQVGETSSGLLFPTHAQDIVESAVLALGIVEQDIESVNPVICPLDVLAQIIISMVGTETWDLDRLFMCLRTTYPYGDLTREQYDLVMNMLAGKYTDSRIRELNPRISIDRLDNTATARKGALLALYMSGGVIPDRGYFHLRHAQTQARIGELDEEFVWEARIGQIFTLGTQNWRIERITHNDVFVLPGSPNKTAPPFWIAEQGSRSFHFSDRIGRFLERMDAVLSDRGVDDMLKKEYRMEPVAAKQLLDFLKKQKKTAGCGLPHRHHLLIEHVASGPAGVPGNQTIIHTLWGGRVNRPFAMAMAAAWEERFGQPLEVNTDNNCVYAVLPHRIPDDELVSMVNTGNMASLIRKRLEGSGFFGARFRECAGRALLISRRKIKERLPLWMNRLKSKKLLDAVGQYKDFPILLETWRTCLKDIFDLENLSLVLTELASGTVTWTAVDSSRPSPMARSGAWRQINEYMYRKDSGASGKTPGLREDLIRELTLTPGLRPTVSRKTVERFQLKRQRLSTGYSPDTPQDLLDWVKERVLVPASEWQALMAAINSDHQITPDALVAPIAEKLIRISPLRAKEDLVGALEHAPRLLAALYGRKEIPTIASITGLPVNSNHLSFPENNDAALAGDAVTEARAGIIAEWLSFYGPVSPAFIEGKLGIKPDRLAFTINDLSASHRVISGSLTAGETDGEICDRENFEILLRLSRTSAVPVFEPVDIHRLPLFVATVQGTVTPDRNIDKLYGSLEQLMGYPVKAELWESEIFPARMDPYDTSWMDTAMQTSDLVWIGGQGGKILFCFAPDLDLIRDEGRATADGQENPEPAGGDIDDLFKDPKGRYDFSSLLAASRENPSPLMERLWHAVWEGQVSNDRFVTLRKGIENRFKVPDGIVKNINLPVSRRGPSGRRFSGRSGFSRWKGAMPYTGNWFRLESSDSGDDFIEAAERKKDRVRLLLDRYGVLFRELLIRELPPFQWRQIFRSLRIMELSGEVLSGYFFNGIPGPQFISHRAFQILRQQSGASRVFWINAQDPASLCGIPLDSLRGKMPRRVAGTHLVYKGSQLVLMSRRNGRVLTFDVPADDPQMQAYLKVFHHLLTRRFQPLRQITIETINGEAAPSSKFVDAFKIAFDVLVDYKQVVLYTRHEP